MAIPACLVMVGLVTFRSFCGRLVFEASGSMAEYFFPADSLSVVGPDALDRG